MIWWQYFFIFIHLAVLGFNHVTKETKPFPAQVVPAIYWLTIEFNLLMAQFTMQQAMWLWDWSDDASQWIWTEGYSLSLFKFALGFAVVEIWFYLTHRFLHRYCYSNIHFIHHLFSNWTFASTTFFSHPLEHLLSNVGLILVSAQVTQMSAGLFWYWLQLVIFEGMRGHAAPINIFGIQLQTGHILHHRFKSIQFGAGGFMDELCQTSYTLLRTQKREE